VSRETNKGLGHQPELARPGLSPSQVRTLPTIKEEDPNTDEKHSAAYYKELQEIRKELPEEIKDFADVFCSED
jgi:ferritin-like protein